MIDSRFASTRWEWPRETGTILDHIGSTPLVRLRRAAPRLPSSVEIHAKLEKFNPGGSVKDRPAAMMLWDGLRRGALRPGLRVLESTSGNTGIALATIAAALGYSVLLTMSAGVSRERRQVLRALGAELVLTDPERGSDGAIVRAAELVERDGDAYFTPQQYDNPANAWAHYLTTAPEIWEETEGRVTHLVAPVGTGGTVVGTGTGLRERNRELTVVAVEPDRAVHGLNGMRHLPSTLRPGIYRDPPVDRLIRVSTEAAYEQTRVLARREGLFVGATSGAVLHAALQVASMEPSAVIACIFPDGGGSYLSTHLFSESAEVL